MRDVFLLLVLSFFASVQASLQPVKRCEAFRECVELKRQRRRALKPRSSPTPTPLCRGTFSSTGNVQSCEVLLPGTYQVSVLGASGGGSSNPTNGYDPFSGGQGAMVTGNLNFDAGTVLQLVVGQAGANVPTNPSPGQLGIAGGGGGGSFIYIDQGNIDSNVPLVIAGAGGGGAPANGGQDGRSPYTGSNYESGTSSYNAGDSDQEYAGGSDGSGGQTANHYGAGSSGGGAGFRGNGARNSSPGNSDSAFGGSSYPTWAGGLPVMDQGDEGNPGGFGGGGGSGYNSGGGGSGYSGGGGAIDFSAGGAGGSYFTASSPYVPLGGTNFAIALGPTYASNGYNGSITITGPLI